MLLLDKTAPAPPVYVASNLPLVEVHCGERNGVFMFETTRCCTMLVVSKKCRHFDPNGAGVPFKISTADL